MPLFNSSAGQHSNQALDATGHLAAIYPPEEALWYYGPLVTDPGGQGVEGFGTEGMGAYGAGEFPVVPAPRNSHEIEQTESYLHEVINGPTPNSAYGEEWVNLQIGGPAGYGNYNEQPYFTGHSQIVQSNPASEQGWGVGPARRWAHYPFSELGNPARNAHVHLRMGALPWVTADSSLYERTQLAWEQQWAPYKQRNPVAPTVPVAPSVPFAQTVPTYGGGYVQYQGLDVPILPDGAGVY